jgi:NAD-dependent deacetylase
VTNAGRVLVITGAGVSAESGIPTFRGKDGYWRNLNPAELATPKAFARDPQLVWEWYRERRERIRNARPNAAHEAISRLAQHTEEFLLVTQNVDDLHARAGMLAQTIVRIHGDIFITRCSRCEFKRHDYPPSQSYGAASEHEHPPSPTLRRASEHEQQDAAEFGVRRHVAALEARTCPRTPKCPECTALMRPGVVWFGEQLPWGELQRVESYLHGGASDVVIVAGTTATFGYIIDWALRASQKGAELIEVNPEETPLSRFATRLVREPAAIALPRIVDRLIRS